MSRNHSETKASEMSMQELITAIEKEHKQENVKKNKTMLDMATLVQRWALNNGKDLDSILARIEAQAASGEMMLVEYNVPVITVDKLVDLGFRVYCEIEENSSGVKYEIVWCDHPDYYRGF